MPPLTGFSNKGFTDTNSDPRQQYLQQLAQQQNQPHGNLLTHLLPTIGSIGGGILGTLVAPVAGTAVGGAAGGAFGTLLENKLEGNSATSNLALNTGLGALGGVGKFAKGAYGAGRALQAGEGAAAAGNALRFGTKGAATIASEGTSGLINQAVTAADANQGTSLLGKMANGANNVGKQAMVSQAGSVSKGTAETATRDINGLRNLGYTSFNSAAQHAPAITGPDGALTVARGQIVKSPQAAPVDSSNFMQMVKDHLSNGISLTDPEKKNILTTAENIANKNKLAGETTPGITSAANIQGALQDIGKIKATTPAAKATVNAIYGDMRSTLGDATANVSVDNNMKSQIVNQLKISGVNNPNVMKAVNQAKTWGDLAQIESKFVTASKVANESQVSALQGGVPGLAPSGKPTLTGLLNQVGGQAIEKGVSATGNLLGKTVKTPVPITTPQQLIGQTAKGMAKGQALPAISRLQSSATPQSPSPQGLLGQPQSGGDATTSLLGQANGGDATSALLGQSQQSQQSGPTMASLQQAIQQDIGATGGKNVNNLMQLGQLYGLVDKSGSPIGASSGNANLGKVSAKDYANAVSGTQGIQQISQMLQSDPSLLAKTAVPGGSLPIIGGYLRNKAGTSQLDAVAYNVADKYLKLTTGAVANKSEIQNTATKMMPRAGDSQQTVQAKLQQLQDYYNIFITQAQGKNNNSDLLMQMNGAQ